LSYASSPLSQNHCENLIREKLVEIIRETMPSVMTIIYAPAFATDFKRRYAIISPAMPPAGILPL